MIIYSHFFCQKINAIPDIIKHEIRNLEESSSGVSSMSSDKKKEADKRKSGPGGIQRYHFYFVPLIYTNKNSYNNIILFKNRNYDLVLVVFEILLSCDQT